MTYGAKVGSQFDYELGQSQPKGFLESFGIQRLLTTKDVDLDDIAKTCKADNAKRFNPRVWRFEGYVVREAEPSAYQTLLELEEKGLPVESPLAFGVNDEGVEHFLVSEYIAGEPYNEVSRRVGTQRRSLLLRPKEFKALGRTMYEFLTSTTAVGDAGVHNFVYHNKKAWRIDVNPENVETSEKQLLELGPEENHLLQVLVADLVSPLRTAAGCLLEANMQRERFDVITEAYKAGLVRDAVTGAIWEFLDTHINLIYTTIDQNHETERDFDKAYVENHREHTESQGRKQKIIPAKK